MLSLNSGTKIYLASGITDMRKGINGLSILASAALSQNNNKSRISARISTGAMFVFRGKRSDRIKILWWDGQGFCLFYKCLNRGRFTWPKSTDRRSIRVTGGQLSMLIEGIDWRNPTWSNPPEYMA
jgi:transposase